MKTGDVLAGLSSLAQETRLAVFRLLVRRGPGGLSAGAIANALDVPASSLSFHLHHLMHAGLITQERRSRPLSYGANHARVNGFGGDLTRNCSAGASGSRVCEVLQRSEGARRESAGRSRPG